MINVIPGARLRRAAAVALTSGAVLATGALSTTSAQAAPAQAAPAQVPLVREASARAPLAPAAATPSIAAKGGFVMNDASGGALYTKAADTKRSTGSTTKIMTAKVVLAQPKLNLDAKVTIQMAYSDYIVSKNASSARLIVGDKVTVRQLLYGLMLPSGCDAAYALADRFGSGKTRAARVKSFIGKMNAEARKLGLKNTHFDSFDGIGNGKNYSTPRDLTKLASSAMKSSTFRTIVKTKKYTAKTVTRKGGTRTMAPWVNTNTLLSSYSGAIGVKTGSGPEAKYCLVFAATRKGKTVVGTVLASTSSDQRAKDATKLMNYGFARLS
ncbi:D-alanyl-D-alanine carboxypeptidase family protein [Streptomyces rochei]|uniref:D-alanyl-D-alanine carboxypeptidase n=1 Tax=Streptomyces rochei TaxID=1928 RepID=A0AAX3ZKI4_STRRO|nr:serine hydrolase [Streptomyces rochei]WMC87429.1 D-alanyl-D-alanine carboxypeptidase [Streptomyces rochei]